MPVPISNVTRRVVLAASGTGPYSFTFEILANTDISVYKDDTLLTLTTDYTVTINSNGTGYVTLTATPTGATQIAIVGDRAIQRTSDFVTGGDLFANTINDELDSLTIFAQQNAEASDRALKAPQTDPTSINMVLPRSTSRANKVLSFDSSGNPAATEFIGSNRGNWAASTTYYVRDIIKDTTNNNIWQCVTQHTSSGSLPIGTNADAAKWTLIVDAASASASATLAQDWAAKTNGQVASTDYSSKAWAIGGTGVTNTASNGAAKEWAIKTSGTVDTSEYSSKEYAVGTQIRGTTGSAKDWAQYTAGTVDGTNYSAKYHASAAATSASNASTSASNAASAQAAAESARDSTLAAFDSFDDRYLGTKTSDPTVDNDGNPLVAGALYFNSVDGAMKVYTGSAWVAAYVSGAGFLATSNNLSELSATASTARTNLGLGSIATQAANNVSISGGSVTGITDLAVADGGTGASTATNAKVNLEVITGSTGSARIPSGTTGERDGSPGAGYFRFNSTTTQFEGYNGTAWGAVGGGNTTTNGLWENANTISANYTIGTNNNALSAGPITVNSGVTVTVPSGSAWTVV